MKYKVTVEYRARVTVDVEADRLEEVEPLAVEQADELLSGCVEVYDVEVREA